MTPTRSMLPLALLLATPAAHAQLGGDPLLPDPARLNLPLGRNGTLELPGDLRLVGASVDGVEVRAEDAAVGSRTPTDTLLSVRLRFRPQYSWIGAGPVYGVEVLADGELHAYPVGDEAPDGLDYDPVWRFRGDTPLVRLNQAYARVLTRYGAAQVGLTRSDFGMGTLAGGGEDPDPFKVRQSPFGYATSFDRVARAMLVGFPFAPRTPPGGGPAAPPLAIALAADAVVEDDTATWADGDRAYQLIAGVFGGVAGFTGGVGGILRQQSYEEGGETEVAIGLVTGRYDLLRGDSRLYVEAEVTGYTGSTDFVRSALRPGDFDIVAVGGLARVGGGHGPFDGVLEAGLASGDDNPVDDEVRTFTFDRNHRVGLLMFGEYSRLTSAVASYNLADESFREFPSRGFDQIANGGAVQNALYLNPRVVARIEPSFALTLGYLYARSEERFVDPYRTALAGGVPTGHRGASEARELGHEVDLGLAWRARLPGVQLTLRGQGAVFVPGEVFDTADGDEAPTVMGYWLHAEVQW